MNRQHYADAVRFLNRAIEAEEELAILYSDHRPDHRFYINRGDCFMALGTTSLAIADFNTAYATSPHDPSVTTRISMMHYSLATSLFNEGDFAGAEIELSAAIKHNPKIAQYFACRGQTAYYQHKFDAACHDFRTALRLDPTYQPTPDKKAKVFAPHMAPCRLDNIRVRLQQFEPGKTSFRAASSLVVMNYPRRMFHSSVCVNDMRPIKLRQSQHRKYKLPQLSNSAQTPNANMQHQKAQSKAGALRMPKYTKGRLWSSFSTAKESEPLRRTNRPV